MITKITKAYIRHYSDSRQRIAYVEWQSAGGGAGRTAGRPAGAHMSALLDRARREGVKIACETW